MIHEHLEELLQILFRLQIPLFLYDTTIRYDLRCHRGRAIMSLTSLLYGVSETSKQKLLQQEFTDNQRATMGSLTSLFGSIFFAIFAIFLGILADKFGPRNALLIKSLISCMVFIPLLRFKKADSKNVSK